MTRRFSNVLLIPLIIVAAVLLVLKLTAPPSPLSGPLAPLSLERIRQAAELVTLKVPVQLTVQTSLSGYSGGVDCLILVRGQVLIGADLDRAALEYDPADDSKAVLTLAEPTVLSSRLDHEKTSILWVSRRGMWQASPGQAGEPKVIAQALQQAQRQMELIAAEPRHLQQARQQAEQVLGRLFSRCGVTLVIRWSTPSPP